MNIDFARQDRELLSATTEQCATPLPDEFPVPRTSVGDFSSLIDLRERDPDRKRFAFYQLTAFVNVLGTRSERGES